MEKGILRKMKWTTFKPLSLPQKNLNPKIDIFVHNQASEQVTVVSIIKKVDGLNDLMLHR